MDVRVGKMTVKSKSFLTALALALFSGSGAWADPLQGSVDEQAPLEPVKSPTLSPMEPMAVPVVKPKPLKGTVEQKTDKPLQSSASEDDEQLNEMNAQSDNRKKVLKGNASQNTDQLSGEDPDSQDQELMVAWDRWRNRLLNSIQSNMQEELVNPDDSQLRWDPETQTMMAKFPLGTSAWFKCQVSADRHITSYTLVRSSGFPNYDKAVARAVRALDGTAILKFPNRSRRSIVTQIAGIKTSENSERHEFKFGDVERYTVPGQ